MKAIDAMNRIERLFNLNREARVRFGDGEFQVVSPGDFVRCAVTGTPIRIEDLRYWSARRQEAYSGAAAALQRHLEMLSVQRA